MLSRVFSFIMAIIVTLFPFLWKPGKSTISNEAVANAVISSVENKDAAAMEEVMCKNIKDNYEDLTGEINNMLSLIEGDIESITWEKFGGYYESDGKGKSVSQNHQHYEIHTTKGVYGIGLLIETSNTFSEEELGIRNIGLSTYIKNDNPDIPYEYVYDKNLYIITATEGIKEMHD